MEAGYEEKWGEDVAIGEYLILKTRTLTLDLSANAS